MNQAAPRRAGVRFVLALAVIAMAPACEGLPAVSATSSPPEASPRPALTVRRTDPVLGISFESLSDLDYLAAALDNHSPLALTSVARLSSASSQTFDVARDVLVEFQVASRDTDDLRQFALQRFSTGANVRGVDALVAGHAAYRMEGAFQNGDRIIVLVNTRPGQVLVVQAYPRGSARIAEFERLLATLQLLP